jgi:hypothetical protein
MATRIRSQASQQLYESDFYAWAKAQAELLRAGRLDELDVERLVEEIEDLGNSLHRGARSRLRTIIEHLLKLEHSPTQDPRGGWYDEVLVQRRDLEDELTPSLRAKVMGELPKLYERSRRDAAQSLRKHGEQAAADALPATCPYSFEQITGDWLP